jgi:hypothetical protein
VTRAVLFVLPAEASVLAAFGLVALDPSVDAVLVVAIALVCVVPLVARAVGGRFDIFEPIVVANLAVLVMYVARPAAMLATSSQHSFKGYDITPHFREAVVIALVGAIALQVGYAAPWAKRTAERLPTALGRWDVGATIVLSLALAAIAFLLFAVFLLESGSLPFLFQLLKGRSSTYDVLYRNSSAYFYGAPALLWPASLLLFATGLAARRRDLIVIALSLTIALGIFAGGQGSRITLLPLVLSPAVYYYLERGRRPGAVLVLVAGYLIFTIGIAYFREARIATERIDRTHELKKAVTNPRFEYQNLILKGVDNDMFESLATETIVVPSKIGASPFDFVYRTLAKPIPRILWPQKPLSTEEQLTTTLYPRERERASSSSGIVGSFYQAGLFPGVVLGLMLIGYAFRLGWEYWRRYPSTTTAKLMLVATLMFVPITLRGGVGDTMARALFGIVPLLVAARICRREARMPQPTRQLPRSAVLRG